MKKIKTLYILSGPAAPGNSKKDNFFYFLSQSLSGFAIGSTWPVELEKNLGDKDTLKESFGNFKYLTFRRYSGHSIIRQIIHIYNYLKLGFKVLKKNEIDIIISYGFNAPGISSAVLSFFTKTPLLVLVPGVPSKINQYTSIKYKKLSSFLLSASIVTTLKQARSIWLLFDGQLEGINLDNKKVFINHDFAPVSLYSPKKIEKNIISFIGYPWAVSYTHLTLPTKA